MTTEVYPAQERCWRYARDLIAAGYALVPVRLYRTESGGKAFVYPTGWRRDRDVATTDPDVLRDWTVQHPDASFAIVNHASGTEGVDLDVKPDNGVDAPAWWRGNGMPVGAMRTATPSGGEHHIWRAGDGPVLPTTAGQLTVAGERVPGVDTRGTGRDTGSSGGLFYAPGAYVWGVDGEPEPGWYEPMDPIVPLADLFTTPDDVLKLNLGKRGSAGHPTDGRIVEKDRPLVKKWGEELEAKARACSPAPGAGFRSALMGVGMFRGRYVENGTMTRDAAEDAMREIVRAVFDAEPDEDDERWIRQSLDDGPRKERWRWRDEPATTSPDPADQADDGWAPMDLGPILRGEVVRAELTAGAARSDGLRFLYPGKEHLAIGETESGKSWFALACVAQELFHDHPVVYVHFEESDPTDTLDRLRLLGVRPERLASRFHFVGPHAPITPDRLAALIALAPTLVVLDGKNEGMALHGLDIMKPDGAAEWRTILTKPLRRAGAATLDLDHVVKDPAQKGSGYSTGSAHKVNGVDGAVFLLENREPFGIGRRGVSGVFVTKDRPGRLRAAGERTKLTRKFRIGEMAVDAEDPERLHFEIWAPKPGQDDAERAEDLAVVVEAFRGVAEMGGGSDPLEHVKLSDLTARLTGRREARSRQVDAAVQAGLLWREVGPRGVHLLSLPTTAPDGTDPPEDD